MSLALRLNDFMSQRVAFIEVVSTYYARWRHIRYVSFHTSISEYHTLQ